MLRCFCFTAFLSKFVSFRHFFVVFFICLFCNYIFIPPHAVRRVKLINVMDFICQLLNFMYIVISSISFYLWKFSPKQTMWLLEPIDNYFQHNLPIHVICVCLSLSIGGHLMKVFRIQERKTVALPHLKQQFACHLIKRSTSWICFEEKRIVCCIVQCKFKIEISALSTFFCWGKYIVRCIAHVKLEICIF